MTPGTRHLVIGRELREVEEVPLMQHHKWPRSHRCPEAVGEPTRLEMVDHLHDADKSHQRLRWQSSVRCLMRQAPTFAIWRNCSFPPLSGRWFA